MFKYVLKVIAFFAGFVLLLTALIYAMTITRPILDSLFDAETSDLIQVVSATFVMFIYIIISEGIL
jgi:hypothetical protein